MFFFLVYNSVKSCDVSQYMGGRGKTINYLLVSFHVFELPEGAHGPHLLQVPVEGQAVQAKAVVAVLDDLQPLLLLNEGGHGYWRRYHR